MFYRRRPIHNQSASIFEFACFDAPQAFDSHVNLLHLFSRHLIRILSTHFHDNSSKTWCLLIECDIVSFVPIAGVPIWRSLNFFPRQYRQAFWIRPQLLCLCLCLVHPHRLLDQEVVFVLHSDASRFGGRKWVLDTNGSWKMMSQAPDDY